jgi:hypothetical protein
MRDALILELGVRELSTFCRLAEFAYGKIEKSGGQDALEAFFYAHAMLGNCAMAARLLRSQALAAHAAGRTIAELLEVPRKYQIEDEAICDMLEGYDARLAKGLTLYGEGTEILDFNIGDRDSFEDDMSLFLRHYDPTVDVLTLLEDELNLALIANEIADIRSRAEAWLESNASLAEQPAAVSIPPSQ